MAAPRLDIFARETLLALCHAALGAPCAAADSLPGAPELLRRIEQAQGRLTEALKQTSEARASLGILAEKLAEARRRLQAVRADRDIQARDNPPLPKRRLFGPKPTPEQAAQLKQRAALAAKLKEAEAALAALEAEQQRVSAAFDAAQTLRQSAEQERRGYVSALQPRLAQEVLCALMTGGAGFAAAQDLLEQARRIVRGDPSIGVLSVLAALFGAESRSAGAHSARDMLGNLRGLFEQHPGPYERVLLAFIALVASGGGQRPSLAEIGIHRPDDFDTSGHPGTGLAHFGLYLLTRVLAGLGFDDIRDGCVYELLTSLRIVEAIFGGSQIEDAIAMRSFKPSAQKETNKSSRIIGYLVYPEYPPQTFREKREAARVMAKMTASLPQLLDASLYSNFLLAEGRLAELPAAVGIDLSALAAPRRRGGKFPALLSLCDKLPAPAWPAETLALWRSLLALHLLCAARGLPLGGAYAQWLEESYGWPKSAFYWRMLAWLKDDESLLRNIASTGWPAI